MAPVERGSPATTAVAPADFRNARRDPFIVIGNPFERPSLAE
jgi:hypothetical protein